MDPMAAIKQTFFQECEEQLAELETGLLAIEGGDHDSETINAVFRAVHSIKGGAGAFGLDELVRFSHVFETAMDKVRGGKLAPDPHVLKVMLRAADILADLVRAARDGGSVDQARCAALADELSALGAPTGTGATTTKPPADDDEMGGLVFQPLQVVIPIIETVAAGPTETTWIIWFKPKADLYVNANESILLLRELERLGPIEVELDASALPLLPSLDAEEAYLAWTVTLTTEKDEKTIRDVFEWVEGDCQLEVNKRDAPEEPSPQPDNRADDIDIAAILSRAHAAIEATPIAAPMPELKIVTATPEPVHDVASTQRPPTGDSASSAQSAQVTIRVDLERIDRLIDLVGELVINQAVLSQRVMESGLGRSSNVAMGLDELEQLTRQIQDSVMATRAQPVKSVFQRMPRLAREVAAMTGKSVRLVTEGEGTEVDKTVIERLTDPLTHMIRNAIDHGLESPEKRLAAGKSAEGVVKLSAVHRSGRIVIEVADDGAGLDRSRIKAIASEKGLIASDAVLSDEETDNLIFLPGFSTAREVSDVSGRGVGMDVVRRSIQALGGRIAISSVPGRGSTFTMSLPLTLAVLDGMVVTVCDQTLVAPLTAVIETLKPKASEVFALGGDARVIAIRGGYVPLIDVGTMLGYRVQPLDASEGVALLVEGEGGARAAILVDAIQGQRQVVIKSLEANYRSVPGIAAATILGDGRVALILDLDALVEDSTAGGVTRLPEQRLAAVG